MIWAEVAVEIHDSLAEAVADIYREYGAGGVAFIGPLLLREAAERGDVGGLMFPDELPDEGPTRVQAYLPVDDTLDRRLGGIRAAIACLCMDSGLPDAAEISVVRVDPEDWAQAWKEHYHVEHVGRRTVIVPSWIDYSPKPDEIVVELDPGQAFGTGQHETTQSALEALERCVNPGCSVLDIGTGSGVLAIAAARLGAARVLAIDIDPVAVEAARANVEANGVDDMVDVVCGDLASGVTGKFDVVVANILADIVIELAPSVPPLLASEGSFISSGFVHKSTARVSSAIEGIGHRVVDQIVRDDWVTLVSREDKP